MKSNAGFWRVAVIDQENHRDGIRISTNAYTGAKDSKKVSLRLKYELVWAGLTGLECRKSFSTKKLEVLNYRESTDIVRQLQKELKRTPEHCISSNLFKYKPKASRNLKNNLWKNREKVTFP